MRGWIAPDELYWFDGLIVGEPPARYADASLAKWIYRETSAGVAVTLDEYVAGVLKRKPNKPFRDLVISVPPGYGSTYLAMALTRAVGAAGATVLYLSTADYIAHIQADGLGTSDNVSAIINSYQLVVIDDFGVRPPIDVDEDLAAGALLRLLDARWKKCLPTVIATSLQYSEIKATGFGVTDRLLNRVSGDVCEFGWEVSHG